MNEKSDNAEAGRIEEMLSEDQFEPEFTGRYREYVWIKEALGGFWADKVFTDVLYRVKPGKEATVYCLRAHPSTRLGLIAAKIYRPRMFRAMRNDWIYRQGRNTLDEEGKTVRDRRSKLAMRKKTRFGKHLITASWNLNEYQTLSTLHAAGADVPRPIAHGHNCILMEHIGDEQQAAPILQAVHLDPGEARRVFDRLIENVTLFLKCDLIHADLSAYNVLYWDGHATIIDFPQAVDPWKNPSAFALFARDIERLCKYFSRLGVACDPVGITTDLWERLMRRHL